jgi:hypothetical protein
MLRYSGRPSDSNWKCRPKKNEVGHSASPLYFDIALLERLQDAMARSHWDMGYGRRKMQLSAGELTRGIPEL